MISPVLAGVLAYVAVQLAIGLLVARGVRSESDFLVAGRNLGMGLAVFTVFATWFGAETCLGAAGAVYGQGLGGGRADPFGYALCLALMGFVFAVPLRRTGALTLGDVFRTRYSPTAESLVVLFLVPASVLWAAAQIRALGQVLAAITGAWHQAFAFEAVRPPGRPWGALESWLVPIVGSITAQELAARVLACRTPAVARNATLAAAGLYLVVGLVPVTLGLAGAGLLPGLEDAEQILPALAARYLNPLGQVLLLGALVSAILSTVDSNLLASAALVQHNVVGRVRPGLDDRARLAVTRVLVVATGVVAWTLAISRDSVYGLVEEASAFGGGGMAVAMAFGLLGRIGGPRAAVAAMAVSLVVQVVGTYAVPIESPMLLSCCVSLVVFVAVGAWERSRPPRAADRCA